MIVIPRKTFLHDRLGTLEKGKATEVPDAIGTALLAEGHVLPIVADPEPAQAQAQTPAKQPGSKRKPVAKP